jgi:Ca2+-binding RTX toxin-like protein
MGSRLFTAHRRSAGRENVMARKTGTSLADILSGTSSADFLRGQGGNDTLKGLGGRDVLEGGGGKDKLFGDAGADILRGGGGNDVLKGGAGNDQMNGNEGRDVMTGGAGADTFVFKHARETRPGSAADVITDFTTKDFINIKNIDANKAVAGNQDFTFIGDAAFTGNAGELKYQFVGSKTIISGDQNGDGQADFQIVLLKHIAITSTNLIGDI